MIADLLGALLGVLVGGGGDGRRKLRRQHEAFAAGEPVTFPVYLVGDLPYCRPAGGFLTVSRQALVASPPGNRDWRPVDSRRSGWSSSGSGPGARATRGRSITGTSPSAVTVARTS